MQIVLEKRQIRRDIYVRYLNRCAELESKLDDYWKKKWEPGGVQAAIILTEFDGDRGELRSLLTLVAIEGPDGVRDAADSYFAALSLETVGLAAVFHEPETDYAFALQAPYHTEILIKRRSAREEMIVAVRSALD